jgi:hypothetical protein
VNDYSPEHDAMMARLEVARLKRACEPIVQTIQCSECGAVFRGTMEWVARWAENHECERPGAHLR